MAKLSVAKDKKHFEMEGQPFFWVGDTVWSAFTNPTFEEWEEYLDFRRSQGFNVLQINTLPQWDRILPDQGIYPYSRREDDSLDFESEPNPEYIARARKICQLAKDRGFQLALVVNWGNLVPGTWLNNVVPTHVWPLEAVLTHVRRVVELYDEYDPIYIVSGDTDLPDDSVIEYYQRSIDLLNELSPDSLKTMHLCGEFTGITDELVQGLDFIMYQSGHSEGSEKYLDSMPTELVARFPEMPILNSEPCYENMPKLPRDWTKQAQGMYHRDDVIDACIRSLKAGAVAGITYGANGLWNWNRNTNPEDIRSTAGDFYARPLHWREAMKLPAASEISGLIKYSDNLY